MTSGVMVSAARRAHNAHTMKPAPAPFTSAAIAASLSRVRPVPATAREVPRQGPQREPGCGTLLRTWRTRRRMSQMDLALDVGVSTRHLSCIETGRARPSAAMLMALAQRLDLPFRERNRLLLAAGFAPQFGEESLQSPAMAAVLEAITRLLAAHNPYPGLALDRLYNIVLGNSAAQQLVSLVPQHMQALPANMVRMSLHPQGLSQFTCNFAQWADTMLDTLERQVQHTADAQLAALLQEVLAYPNVAALRAQPRQTTPLPALLVPCEMAFPFGRLNLFSTLSAFGTPRDITLQELSIELFYPADAASEALLRALSPAQSA